MKWREIGPYLQELWHRPAGPMNWKNPIRVFAVLGWLIVQGVVLLGWTGWRLFQGLMLLGWTVFQLRSRASRRCYSGVRLWPLKPLPTPSIKL